MKTRMQAPSLGKYVVSGMLGLGALLFCLIVGLLAAIVPPGLLVRVLAIPMALMGMMLLWIIPKRRHAPEWLMNVLLFGLLALINLWPAYIVYRFGGMPSVNPTKLAWLMFLAVASIGILSCEQPMLRLAHRCRRHPLLITCVLFLFAWRIISAASGVQPIPQVLSLGAEIVSCYIAFFLALGVLRDERDVLHLIIVLVGVALLQAMLASFESVVKHTLFDRFISVSSEDSAVMADMLREKFRDGHYRAQGTFEHPMVLAEFMAMMVPLAAALFLTSKNFWLRWGSAALVPLAILIILASRSRAGVAVLVGAVLLVLLLLMTPRDPQGKKGSGKLLVAVTLVFPLVLLGIYFGMQEFSSLVIGRSHTEVGSTMVRVLMLQRGLPLLYSSPLVGYGNGMGVVKLGFFDGVRFNIDNYWLGVALDSGFPGLLAFLGIFGGAALMGAHVYRKRVDSAGTMAGLIGVSLLMLLVTKTVLSISSGLTLGYVLIAAVVVLGEKSRAPLAVVEKNPLAYA